MKLTKPISVRGTTVSTGDSSERYREKLARITLDAFKFTFDGTIRVTLAWNGATVSLTVADTGIGIAPDQLTRIFDRFHRVPNARGRTHEGTGIGLALVQELARLHGGQTKAESVVDQGSIFTVSIKAGVAHLPKERISPGRKLASPSTAPSAYVEEALRWLPDSSPDVLGKSNSAAEPKAPGSSGMARAERAKARILLADDNADMREYVQRLLIQQGYEVTAVADGEAALLAARARPPNLVLSDVMLPNLDGIELVKALRGDRDLKVIPVVLLSARAGEEARVQGLKHGADDYLIKPFSHRDLLARLESHLELAQVRQTAADSERRERERIEFLTDAAQIGVWFCDLPFDKLEWDHRVKEHFWLPPDAAVTIQTFSERLHPEDRERTHLAIEDSIAKKSRYEVDYRTVSPDGQIKWIRVIGHPHFDSNGTPTRFDGISIDITSRVHAESRSRFLVSLDDELRPLIDPHQIMLTAARVLGNHLHVDRCAYADVEADADTMNLAGNYVRASEIKSIVGRLKFSDFGPEVLRLMRQNLPFTVPDIDHHEPSLAHLPAYRAAQIRSVICVPLHKAGHFVAAMAVHMTARDRRTQTGRRRAATSPGKTQPPRRGFGTASRPPHHLSARSAHPAGGVLLQRLSRFARSFARDCRIQSNHSPGLQRRPAGRRAHLP